MLKPTNSLAVRNKFQPQLIPLYSVMLLLVFISVFIAYVHSTYLSQFLPESLIGLLYTIGSGLGLLVFLFISRVLHRLGNYQLMFGLLCLNGCSLLLMAFVSSPPIAIVLFLAHLITLPIIFYNADIFLEAELDNKESSTGTKRGLLLTLTGLVAAAAPLVMGVAIPESGSFVYVYSLAALLHIPVAIIIALNLRHFSDPKYTNLDIFKAIASFWKNPNVRDVYVASLVLNMFFAMTVIYAPLYLISEIGLTWNQFGLLMSIAILAYLIFEYPVGYIADNYTGEKEFMALGFTILILTTAAMAFMTTTTFFWWALLLFIMRVGASIVEVTTESYFFKKTKSSDAQIISFFRTGRPISYILITFLSSFALYYLPFNLLFVVCAVAFLPALFFVMNLEDTK